MSSRFTQYILIAMALGIVMGTIVFNYMPTPGLNYRLPDLLCAIGIPQMARLEALLVARERVAGWYAERLEHHG